MRSIGQCSAKICLGLGVYFLLFLAGVFSILSKIVQMISRVLERLPSALIAFVLCLSVVLTIGFLTGAGDLREGWLAYTIVVMWVVVGVVCWLLSLLGPMAVGVVQAVFSFVNPGIPSAWLASGANHLAEAFLKLENGDEEPWISIITFPYTVTEWAGMLLGFIVKIAVCIGTPALFAWMGYGAIFSDMAPYEKGSADWWLCTIFCALCGVLGLFLGTSAIWPIQNGSEE